MQLSGYSLSFDEFRALASQGNLIPLYKEILADVETPVSAFTKIDHGPSAYLLESVEGGENWARYSFLGSGSPVVIREDKGEVAIVRGSKVRRLPMGGNPLDRIKEILETYQPVTVPGLPRFVGGAVGYLGYDVVRSFEDIPARRKDALGLPEFAFLITDTLLIFDNVAQTIKVVANAHVASAKDGDLRRAYADAIKRIEGMIARLRRPLRRTKPKRRHTPLTFTSNMSRADFEKMVTRSKDYIKAGDIFQVVLSQRLQTETKARPFDIYRTLRVVNPSPFMFYIKAGPLCLVGSSPEIMVRVEGDRVLIRPLAGTRRRGKTEEEDERLAAELLADPKERAEHIMLVDLGRNDVGRVARYGTLQLSDVMAIERYSHVMHLCSTVSGRLQEGKTAFDALRACLPAGTLSGAPKVRAMEIIDELEPQRRGPYGGAVGYIDFSGNMDTCIALRTLVLNGQTAYIQAGAGIVADSVPETEREETLNKAMGLLRALEIAETQL